MSFSPNWRERALAGLNNLVLGLLHRPGSRARTIAELYEVQELPEVLVSLMTDTPWCDEVGESVPVDDPAMIHLTPMTGET